MPAQRQLRSSDGLLPANDYASAVDETIPALKVVSDTDPHGSRLPQPDMTAALDPLHAIKMMSEEEKIALCS